MSEELTFKEITQIALGGVDFNDVNISLLYTVIDLLLKKLNCENEKVVVRGIPAQRLQELLCQSNTGPPLVPRDEQMKRPIKPYEKLDELEKQVAKLETDLEEHVENVKPVRYVPEDSEESDQSSGIMPCTLFCDVEEPKSEVVGALLKSKWFFMQLKEFTKFPLICRFNKLDIKFRELENEIHQYKIKFATAHKRIDKVEELFVDLLEFQKVIRENYAECLTTMDEIQEVMDLKVNNIEMPPLKRSIYALVKRMENEVNYLKYVQTKPRALLCVAEPSAMGKIPEVLLKKFTKDKRSHERCGCQENLMHPSLTERLDVLDKNAVLRRSTMEAICFK